MKPKQAKGLRVPPIRKSSTTWIPLSYFERIHNDINSVNSEMTKILKQAKRGVKSTGQLYQGTEKISIKRV